MANIDRDWQAKYESGETPWDSGIPSRELRSVLVEYGIPPSRALELGCGSGTNAVFLAQAGFDVTAVDCAPSALEAARQKANEAGVTVNWIDADVQNLSGLGEPFAFVFDRGCYHCCRRVDLDGYLGTLRRMTQPGAHVLCLTGNADEQTEHGPPRLTAAEIRDELGRDFHILHLREFRFEDPGGVDGPLGWSCLMRRE